MERLPSRTMSNVTLVTIATLAGWLLGLIIGLLLLYMVIRLAVTHGMLSYHRRIESERGTRHQP